MKYDPVVTYNVPGSLKQAAKQIYTELRERNIVDPVAYIKGDKAETVPGSNLFATFEIFKASSSIAPDLIVQITRDGQIWYTEIGEEALLLGQAEYDVEYLHVYDFSINESSDLDVDLLDLMGQTGANFVKWENHLIREIANHPSKRWSLAIHYILYKQKYGGFNPDERVKLIDLVYYDDNPPWTCKLPWVKTTTLGSSTVVWP